MATKEEHEVACDALTEKLEYWLSCNDSPQTEVVVVCALCALIHELCAMCSVLSKDKVK